MFPISAAGNSRLHLPHVPAPARPEHRGVFAKPQITTFVTEIISVYEGLIPRRRNKRGGGDKYAHYCCSQGRAVTGLVTAIHTQKMRAI